MPRAFEVSRDLALYDSLVTPIIRQLAMGQNVILCPLLEKMRVIPAIQQGPNCLIRFRVDGTKIVIRSGTVGESLRNLNQALSLRPNQRGEVDPDLVFVEKGDVPELVSWERTAFELWKNEFKPGNPEIAKKYVYSLYCTRQALRENFQGWERRLLPKLGALANSSLFARHAYLALHALQRVGEGDEDAGVQNAFILSHIRNALEQVVPMTGDLDEARKIILQFCHLRLTGVHMYPFLEDFVLKALRAPQADKGSYELPQFTFQGLAEDIQAANKRLENLPPEYRLSFPSVVKGKLQGTAGLWFDPIDNTPWVHSIQKARTEKGVKSCTVLRHPTPTVDPGIWGAILRNLPKWFTTSSSQAAVVPEYRAYLAAAPDRVTLYVNHQEHGEGAAPEKERSRAIQLLEKSHPNFHFLALPFDGPIWTESYLNSRDIEGLKTDLVQFLERGSHGFALPQGFDIQQHGPRIRAILNQVHELYFEGDKIDKQVFILLFYSELTDYFKNFFQADLLVKACRDNRDRGTASTNTDMAKNLVKLGKECDPDLLRELYFSVLAPSILKSGGILEDRLELLLKVLRHLASLSPEQKKKIRKAPPLSGYQIVEQMVPKEKTGWAQMVGPHHFLSCVKNMHELGEKRIIKDSSYQENVISSFFRNGTWDRKALEDQLTKDFSRIDLRLNGKRILNFKDLLNGLKIEGKLAEDALPFMSMLQQGAVVECLKSVANYLHGNALGLTLAEHRPSQVRKDIIQLIGEYHRVGSQPLLPKLKPDRSPEVTDHLISAVNQGLLPAEFSPVGERPPLTLPIYSTRIDAKFGLGVRRVSIEQDLRFFDPGGKLPEYFIAARLDCEGDRPATISWGFTP